MMMLEHFSAADAHAHTTRRRICLACPLLKLSMLIIGITVSLSLKPRHLKHETREICYQENSK